MTGVTPPNNHRPVPAQWAETLVLGLFRALRAIENFRKANPKSFNTILGVFSFLIAYGIWLKWGDSILQSVHVAPDSRVGSMLVLAGHHVIWSAVSFVVLRLSLPFLGISQRAIATYEMGLRWASTTAGDVQNLLRWYLQKHPRADSIRLICISGHSLFGNEKESTDCLLRPWAEHGRLDVVMPASSEANPTIEQRWLTYTGDFRRHYETARQLVSEVDAGKEYLRAHRNSITEHHILCMWRVIILQKYCIVQNYFPNDDGLPSDSAPTFVYENTGPNSYYQMYLVMFKLIKDIAQRHGVPAK